MVMNISKCYSWQDFLDTDTMAVDKMANGKTEQQQQAGSEKTFKYLSGLNGKTANYYYIRQGIWEINVICYGLSICV